MYRYFIRPILFLLSPESVHHLLTRFLRVVFIIPGLRRIISVLYTVNDPRLERDFLGLKFKNPVGLAAGFDKNGEVFNEFSAFGFSHIEVGTVTPLGQPGNPKPRSFRLPKDKALINRMGFNNKGLDALVNRLSEKRASSILIGGNIGKNTLTPNEQAVEDYLANFKGLWSCGLFCSQCQLSEYK